MSGRHCATAIRPAAAPTHIAPPAVVQLPFAGARRSRRLAKQRSRRRRVLAALITALIVIAIAVPIVLLASQRVGGTAKRGAPPPRTQRTLQLSVRGADGNAVESVLLAADPRTGQATGVFIPSRVIAEVPGSGSLPFGRALGLGDPTLPAETVADLLGVTVDGSWVLDTGQLARLVDIIGAVSVDVAVDVVAPGAGGTGTVVIPAGRARLSGAQAVQYATYLAPGEDETAQVPRATAVLQALLAEMPSSSRQLAARLAPAHLGQLASTSATMLYSLLAQLGSAQRAGDMLFQTLPVKSVDTGGQQATYLLDATAARALVDRSLAASVPAGLLTGGKRVLVLNGALTPGIGVAVRAKLVAHGLVYVGSRNAAAHADRTSVLIFARTPAAVAQGHQVAAAIGLPQAPVEYSPRGQSVADTIVIVGDDFRS